MGSYHEVYEKYENLRENMGYEVNVENVARSRFFSFFRLRLHVCIAAAHARAPVL